MTTEQAIVFGILGVMLALFVWERIRYDLVALLALLASVVLGVVPADEAFDGFSDPAVITVAAVLVISKALGNSGVLERALRPFDRWTHRPEGQIIVLAGLVATASAFMNNVGALALFLPAALELTRKRGTSPALVLMPMAFASLLGGLITLIGTPPNLLISRIRREAVGEPFAMFDFTAVGLTLTVAGLLLLAVTWRLLPADRKGTGDPNSAFRIDDYLSEVRLTETSPMAGRTIGELEDGTEGTFRVLAILRRDGRRVVPSREWLLRPGDVLQVETEPKALERALAEHGIELSGSKALPTKDEGRNREIGVVEGVVGADSALIGRTPSRLGLRERFGVNLLAVSRPGGRPTTQLKGIVFHSGDVLMLQGRVAAMRDQLATLGVLPLAGRELRIGERRLVWLTAALMAAAVLLASLEVLPPAIAFMGAVAGLLLTGAVRLDEGYSAVSWPVIVLLGALIPVSGALETSGGTALIASLLTQATLGVDPILALAMVMLATMMVTPLLNNAATVLLMAPIAVGYAKAIGLAPDPFLMAVAVGASSDFLTPIGHQSNTLVLAPGGYRFTDYARLGFPLTLLVLALGVPLIAFFWPLVP
jgi:di/tricarboxylate transporter